VAQRLVGSPDGEQAQADEVVHRAGQDERVLEQRAGLLAQFPGGEDRHGHQEGQDEVGVLDHGHPEAQ
jgi:hypothetical protein